MSICWLSDIVRAHDNRERRLRVEREFNDSIAHLTPQRQDELRALRRRKSHR